MKKLLYYAPEKLSGKQSLTPEGFLLCEDVGIARTGSMMYGPNETPVETGPDGFVMIDRDEREVFRPEYIASLNGKPVCDNHPPVDVNPENWSEHTIGVVLNPRRGAGAQDDILFADLLITKKNGIELVRSGKRQISAGYNADYEQTAPGRGRQINLVGNHVALVESGRCGNRCAIGDKATEITPRRKRMTFAELRKRVNDAFKKNDEGALNDVLDEMYDQSKNNSVHVHVHDKTPEAGDDEKGNKEGVQGKPEGKVADKGKRVHTEVGSSAGATMDDKGHRMTDSELDSRFKKIEDAVDSLSKDVKKVIDKAFKDAKEDEEEEEEEEVNKREDKVDDKKKKAKDAEESEEEEEKEVNKREDKVDDKKKKARDAALNAAIDAELPVGTARTTDSVCLEAAYQQAVSLAEIIKPGIEVPKFDKKALATKTYDSICNLRRSALEEAEKDAELKGTVSDMLNGRSVRDAVCGEVRMAFHAVASMKKRMNNQINTARRTGDNHLPVAGGQKVKTAAEVNKANAEFWANR